MSTDMQSGNPTGHCPIDHHHWGHQKTARPQDPATSPVECDEYGIWHIHGFKEARTVLRSRSVKQVGVGAELFDKTSVVKPFIYMEGKKHQEYRRQTARFFTPKAVNSNYQHLIEQQVDEFIALIKRQKQVDLYQFSHALIGSVVYKIIGLTHSRVPGMQDRVDTFIKRLPDMQPRHSAFEKGKGNKISLNPLRFIEIQSRLLVFYLLDVQPAIWAHRRQPEDDLISHLLAENYNDLKTFTECITFAVAGIQAPREFMCAAAWHFLEQPELRTRYLVASDKERDAMLQEILRLESVVERIFRRALEDIPVYVESTHTHVTIPKGALIIIDVYGANSDERVVSGNPLQLCPVRELKQEGVSNSVMSFGDGNHRCPGSYIALRVTDIFLRRLLVLEGLHIIKQPDVAWNDFLTAYMLRNFIVGIDS
jgi:cytochrome P450